MDIYCVKCGEPWDLDSLHDEVELRRAGPAYGGSEHDQSKPYEQLFGEVRKDFTRKGCVAIGGTACQPVKSARTAIAAEISDLLGDDIDGAASLLDDAAYLGVLD